jgi:hypothetical protein
MVEIMLPPDEAADRLREQASCCRRLARNSRTEAGPTALLTVASQFESDAFRLERRRDGLADHDNAPQRLRAALAWQDALYMRPGATRTATISGNGDLELTSIGEEYARRSRTIRQRIGKASLYTR